MDYRYKSAAVNRFQDAVRTVIKRYYTDDVGRVRHTPKVYYRVLRRNLKSQKARVRRAELIRFSKIAFFLSNCKSMDRRQVEFIFDQLFVYDFLIGLLFEGFKVSVTAVKKALVRFLRKVSTAVKFACTLFSRLFDLRIYLQNAEFLI